MRLWLGVVCLMLMGLAPGPPLTVVVEGGHFKSEPAYVRLRIRVEPDPDNRGLWVSAVSDDFATSSYKQLARDSAPTRWVIWKDIPAGVYTVVAVVERGADRPWRASAGFQVIGR